MDIETENIIEEIHTEIEKCINCGMCKGRCPVFQAMKEETNSPRARANYLKEKVYDKIFYQCTLCKSCELNCPLGIKLPETFRKARRILVLGKKDPKQNHEMIENVKKFGTPFGKVENGKPKNLYCC